MHRYRIVAQISLILFILNLVLAAPTVVQEIHGAHDEAGASHDGVAEAPQEGVAEASHDGVAEAPQEGVAEASHDGVAEASHDGVAEASHDGVAEASHDGIAEASHDGVAEASQHAMASPQHSLDGSVSSGYSIPYPSADSDVSGYSWLLERPPRLNLERPSSLHDTDSTSLHPISGPMDITLDEWLHGWLPPEGSEASEPSNHLTLDESLPSPPPTVTPPNNAGFFNNNMMKKLKIVAGLAIVGGTIATIVGLQVKHHKHRDFQYS